MWMISCENGIFKQRMGLRIYLRQYYSKLKANVKLFPLYDKKVHVYVSCKICSRGNKQVDLAYAWYYCFYATCFPLFKHTSIYNRLPYNWSSQFLIRSWFKARNFCELACSGVTKASEGAISAWARLRTCNYCQHGQVTCSIQWRSNN